MRYLNKRIMWAGLLVAVLAVLSYNTASITAQRGDPGTTSQTGQISPDSEADLAEGPDIEASVAEAARERLFERREQMAAAANAAAGSGRPETDAGDRSDETAAAGVAGEFHGTPSTVVIPVNNRNTLAQSVSNTLAEPAAVGEGRHAFYMGNTYAGYSTNNGATYTSVSFGSGPSDASIVCCDPDVIYDQGRGVTFYLILFINSSATNGVVRIYVRRQMNLGNNCSYTIDPAGTANNILPDYPHLGLSNDFLYLATNNVPTSGGAVHQVRRFNIDQMADCVTASTNTYSSSGPGGAQRVVVPVDGARETMYWAWIESATTLRIFSWPESSTSVSSVLKTLSHSSAFVNPDCRGGTGNFDFIERSTAWSIAGFRLRGAVGANRISFYWNVGNDSSHPQGHVHSAVVRESDKALIAQPHIHNSGMCFGFPVVGVNDRGDLGLSIAGGGRAGGGGTAAQGYVGVDDDYTSGFGFFGTVFLTASGTHNRSDGRFGDYFTSRRNNPCGLFWTATNYALSGGNTSASHVNARYIEFGRNRDRTCHTLWFNEDR